MSLVVCYLRVCCATKLLQQLLNAHTHDTTGHELRNSKAPTPSPRCFLEQETLPLLISTGWFQERIRA